MIIFSIWQTPQGSRKAAELEWEWWVQSVPEDLVTCVCLSISSIDKFIAYWRILSKHLSLSGIELNSSSNLWITAALVGHWNTNFLSTVLYIWNNLRGSSIVEEYFCNVCSIIDASY